MDRRKGTSWFTAVSGAVEGDSGGEVARRGRVVKGTGMACGAGIPPAFPLYNQLTTPLVDDEKTLTLSLHLSLSLYTPAACVYQQPSCL
ncbi:hypothetical protein L1987_75973 [Smallanthus sonchifolius]|uniref:Uncharacterized protein n=1 Tax=Smallanthus sonchifolius TaxID=185202 RepID=A0ACB9A7A5_9ASTR|nr:hypothetical protein L1987_75973 [Smallanthus sonchifolius]